MPRLTSDQLENVFSNSHSYDKYFASFIKIPLFTTAIGVPMVIPTGMGMGWVWGLCNCELLGILWGFLNR